MLYISIPLTHPDHNPNTPFPLLNGLSDPKPWFSTLCCIYYPPPSLPPLSTLLHRISDALSAWLSTTKANPCNKPRTKQPQAFILIWSCGSQNLCHFSACAIDTMPLLSLPLPVLLLLATSNPLVLYVVKFDLSFVDHSAKPWKLEAYVAS